jgi:tryptophan-rich sensory protein
MPDTDTDTAIDVPTPPVVQAPGVDETGTAPEERPHRWLALGAFAAPVVAAAVLGSRFSPAEPTTRRWFRRLDKPPFQPPDAAFGPVWTVLYTSIAVSGWRVWCRPSGPERSRALALWAAQLAANAAWTPAFFGARRPKLALGVLGAQLSSAAAYAATAARVDRPAAAMVVPYLGWSGFAGVLNTEIVRRNPRA